MNNIVLALPIIAGSVTKFTKKNMWAYSFFVAFVYSVCALGWYYNSLSRMGNIFVSDIYLLLFTIVYLAENRFCLYVNKQDFAVLTGMVFFELGLVLQRTS